MNYLTSKRIPTTNFQLLKITTNRGLYFVARWSNGEGLYLLYCLKQLKNLKIISETTGYYGNANKLHHEI